MIFFSFYIPKAQILKRFIEFFFDEFMTFYASLLNDGAKRNRLPYL